MATTRCESPLQEGVTDDEGAVTLTVPSAPEGLAAFITATKTGYLPSDFWFITSDPSTRLARGTMTWQIVSENTASLLSTIVQAPLDPTRGSVSFVAADCALGALPGITVTADTADEDTTTMYMTGALPSTAITATAESGAGALLNLTPGMATIMSST